MKREVYYLRRLIYGCIRHLGNDLCFSNKKEQKKFIKYKTFRVNRINVG